MRLLHTLIAEQVERAICPTLCPLLDVPGAAPLFQYWSEAESDAPFAESRPMSAMKHSKLLGLAGEGTSNFR